MATTNRSTKAKTKIVAAKTRKSSNAAAKKPSSSTTKAVTTVKKSVSSKVVKGTGVKKTFTIPRIRAKGNIVQQLYIISAVATVGLAVAAGLLMNTRAYQLFVGLLTRDDLASQTSTVFVPAIHSVYDLELRWAVVVIMALSTILPLVYLYLTRKRNSDKEAVGSRLLFWRWLDTGVITALMVEVVALLSGVQDILVLKVLAAVVVISALLRWVVVKQQAENPNQRGNATSILGIVSCLLPGVIVGGYALTTVIYGMVHASWYVYALYAALVIGFLAYLVNLRFSIRRFQSSAITQRNDIVIGLMTRVAFAAILILGLKK